MPLGIPLLLVIDWMLPSAVPMRDSALDTRFFSPDISEVRVLTELPIVFICVRICSMLCDVLCLLASTSVANAANSASSSATASLYCWLSMVGLPADSPVATHAPPSAMYRGAGRVLPTNAHQPSCGNGYASRSLVTSRKIPLLGPLMFRASSHPSTFRFFLTVVFPCMVALPPAVTCLPIATSPSISVVFI